MAANVRDHKHLVEQIEQIADECENQRVSVIVQLTPEPELVEYLQDSAVARHQRQSIITARDLLPPPRRPATPARKGATAAARTSLSVKSAPFYGRFAVGLEGLTSVRTAAMTPVLKSDWIQKTLPQPKRKSKRTQAAKEPVHFTTTGSLVLELSRDELSELPQAIPNVAEVYANRTVRVPSTSRAEELPAVVVDNKSYTWGVSRTGALATWGAFQARGEGVKVAVLDTGVDPRHPDLKDRIAGFIEFDGDGRKLKEGVKNAHDDDGHGTHCAGTICGGNASGRWIGMAPEAKVVAVKVLTKGSGTDAQILAGLDWAIRQGVHVISMSLGALRMSADVLDTYTLALFNANRLGIPIVVAVGNEGSQTTGSPGNDYFAFTVGATDSEDRAAGFSGGRTQIIEQSRYLQPRYLPLVYSKPDATAPGVAIYSSVPGGKWKAWNGSSMATPHVAGAFALLLSPQFQISQLAGQERTDVLQALLTATVRELGEAGQNHRFGYGRIDILRACGYARELGY